MVTRRHYKFVWRHDGAFVTYRHNPCRLCKSFTYDSVPFACSSTRVKYTICDLVLLFQVYYYRRFPSPSAHQHITSDESTPLLPEPRQPKPLLPPVIEYPVLLGFVLLAGAGAWFLTDRDEVHVPEDPEVTIEWKSQALGWASAVLYLGSRIPQIVHN